jgi:hypothetical protein
LQNAQLHEQCEETAIDFYSMGLSFLIDYIINALPGNPILSNGIATLLTLYFITVHARLLGLFYRKEAEKLDWF